MESFQLLEMIYPEEEVGFWPPWPERKAPFLSEYHIFILSPPLPPKELRMACMALPPASKTTTW